jgi:short-subunit dehydrogenase
VSGLRVVVTGASSGLGVALARQYAAQGATLALMARRGEELHRLAEELRCPCHLYPLDVTDAAAMREAAADFIGRAGAPDRVIANAGISIGTLTQDASDLPVFERVMAVNVIGMVNTFQPFIGPMTAAGGGTLAGIASVAGIRGLPGAGAYSASKAATISYLESLRGDLRGTGIKVVTVAPGYIETPMTAINTYRMPFILEVDEGARRIVRVIEAGRSYAVVPWQMAIVSRIMRVLPNWLFDALAARAGRKRRGLPT